MREAFDYAGGKESKIPKKKQVTVKAWRSQKEKEILIAQKWSLGLG